MTVDEALERAEIWGGWTSERTRAALGRDYHAALFRQDVAVTLAAEVRRMRALLAGASVEMAAGLFPEEVEG